MKSKYLRGFMSVFIFLNLLWRIETSICGYASQYEAYAECIDDLATRCYSECQESQVFCVSCAVDVVQGLHCPKDSYFSGGYCVPSSSRCPNNNSVLISGLCQQKNLTFCPKSFTYKDGICFNNKITEICMSNFELCPIPNTNCKLKSGSCSIKFSCPANQIMYNGGCVTSSFATCPLGYKNVNGNCICSSMKICPFVSCPIGSIDVNGTCVLNKECPIDKKIINGICAQCPLTLYLINGQCEQCPFGTVHHNGRCLRQQCASNQILLNGTCSPLYCYGGRCCKDIECNFCFKYCIEHNSLTAQLSRCEERCMDGLLPLNIFEPTDSSTQIPDSQSPDTEPSETEPSETEPPETEPPESPFIEPPETEPPEIELPETDTPETESPEIDIPETELPETKRPETERPEIERPETERPETELPVTESPETELPETEPPEINLTEPPEIEISETEPPEIELPETEPPETELPETERPETERPETELPVTESPETELPETESPEINLTEPPEIEILETEPPKIELPETEPPEIELPETEPPETESPEIEPPDIDSSETDPPEIESSVTEREKIEPPETEPSVIIVPPEIQPPFVQPPVIYPAFVPPPCDEPYLYYQSNFQLPYFQPPCIEPTVIQQPIISVPNIEPPSVSITLPRKQSKYKKPSPVENNRGDGNPRVINITNIVNDSSTRDHITNVNHYNVNDLDLTSGINSSYSNTEKGQNDECCVIVEPKECKKVKGKFKCFHRKHHTCGPMCTSYDCKEGECFAPEEKSVQKPQDDPSYVISEPMPVPNYGHLPQQYPQYISQQIPNNFPSQVPIPQPVQRVMQIVQIPQIQHCVSYHQNGAFWTCPPQQMGNIYYGYNDQCYSQNQWPFIQCIPGLRFHCSGCQMGQCNPMCY